MKKFFKIMLFNTISYLYVRIHFQIILKMLFQKSNCSHPIFNSKKKCIFVVTSYFLVITKNIQMYFCSHKLFSCNYKKYSPD